MWAEVMKCLMDLLFIHVFVLLMLKEGYVTVEIICIITMTSEFIWITTYDQKHYLFIIVVFIIIIIIPISSSSRGLEKQPSLQNDL